jgi:two-component sensor histidine kinase
MGNQREVWGRRKNGEDFPAEAAVSRHSVGGKTILTVVHRDITQRKELDEQREVIAHELDHRVRNVLSVVSSLVSLSARSATSVEELAHSLHERLRALAATQTLLWGGERKNVDLSALLQAELAHFSDSQGANVVIKGEPVALSPAAVQPLALAVHELATNSAKYGALSDPRGRVIVTCEGIRKEDEPMLAIEWRETGGPPVKPPSRRGFGTTLIEGMVKRTFQADVSVDYRPEGLVCRLVLPRAKVEQMPTEAERALGS